MRQCTVCYQERPLEEFRFRASRGRHAPSCKSCEREYQRRNYWAAPDKAREKASLSMRKLRADPARRDEQLAKQRAYYHEKAKFREKSYYEDMKAEQPWRWRARNLKRNISPEITEEWLGQRWDAQGGTCALSGRPLEVMTFEVDHIVPRSRGGSDCLSNLRLLSPEANAAKGRMLDEELLALCQEILAKSRNSSAEP